VHYLTLARHVGRTMPWSTLCAGCLAGTVFLAVMAHVADVSHTPLGPGDVRIAFLPAIAALAFIPRTPFRPVAQATPVPAWVAPAGRVLLAAPILALTCWAQLTIAAHAVPVLLTAHSHPPLGHSPAVYPVIAQLTGWCAVTVAVAACVDRSRYADVGGAVAVPVSFAAIALAWYAPLTSRLVAQPPATPHGATVAWCAVTAIFTALTCAAMRDRWHRYTRVR